ncbi:MAG: RHS repeat-associated core domain-containing protein [Gemmatales bacterium]|nr:RHS repeat-associated core domain-containing protein [Gemmatales bacterium]
MLDESGALFDQIAYNAFNVVTAQANPHFDNPILFASREFDTETGLYYNRARYYDPVIGRWTTEDPLGFAAGKLNVHRYVFNAATSCSNPSGQAVPLALFVIAFCGGAWLVGETGCASYQAPGTLFHTEIWVAAVAGIRIGVQTKVSGIPTAVRDIRDLVRRGTARPIKPKVPGYLV